MVMVNESFGVVGFVAVLCETTLGTLNKSKWNEEKFIRVPYSKYSVPKLRTTQLQKISTIA